MPSTEAVVEPSLDTSVDQYLSYLEGFRRCAPNTIAAYSHDLQGFLELSHTHGLLTPGQVTASVLET